MGTTMNGLHRTARSPLRPVVGRVVARVDLSSYREACALVKEAAAEVQRERRALAYAACIFVMSAPDRAVMLEDLARDESATGLALIEEMLATLDQAARDYPPDWPRPRQPAPAPVPAPEAVA